MDNSLHKVSESSLKKIGDKTENVNAENKKEEMRIELKNSIKKVSYAFYLLGFILWIMISSIYLVIKIDYALILFDDIYINWTNHFIQDIFEKKEGMTCQEDGNSQNLIHFQFKGSASGCFCEDCSDDHEHKISGLLHGKDIKEDQSSEEYFESRRLQDKDQDDMLSPSTNNYADYDEDDLDSILNYKIISRTCAHADELDSEDFYSDIRKVESKTINYLLIDNKQEINLCISRSKDSHFINSYYTSKTECSDDEMLCQGQNETDKSFWFCIKKNEKCPIRQILIVKQSDTQNYKDQYEEEIKLSNGYSLLISRKLQDVMPISEFAFFENDGPCISAKGLQRWKLSQQNIIFNPLLYGQYSFKCDQDTRYLKSNFQVDQKTLFQHAQILDQMVNSQYPKFFLPQQSVIYYLFYRRYIEFDIDCRYFFEDVYKLGININKLEKMSITVLVCSAVLSLFNIVDIIYILIQLWKKNNSQPYPWKNCNVFCIIYSILKYPLAFSLCILDFVLFYKMITCREIGQDIINRHCTDKITSDQFSFMRNNLSFYGIFFHIIVCFCFWSADLLLINFIRKYCLMNQKKMTPFDEFFSIPKAENKYKKIDKQEQNDNEIYLGHKNEDQRMSGSSNKDNNNNEDNHNMIKQDDNHNNLNNYQGNLFLKNINLQINNHSLQKIEKNYEMQNEQNNNQNIQSISQQDLGSQLPQLMTDLSKKQAEPLPHFEQKQSKKIVPAADEKNDLINLEETEEDFYDND